MENLANKFESMMFTITKFIHKTSNFNDLGCGLSFSQSMILNLLSKLKTPKMKDLAKELGVTLSNVTGIVDRLIKSGYVKRQDDPKDRRIVRIMLTKKGEEISKNIYQQKQHCINKIFSKLSQNDRQTIIKIMEKLVNEIRKEGD